MSDTNRMNNMVLNELKEAIIACDVERSKKAAQTIVDIGIDPLVVLQGVIVESSKVIGDKFETGEYFLPQLIMAGNAMTEASRILEASLPKNQMEQKPVVVIGTVQGDRHTIGKNIVSMMLASSGFIVHDLGIDVRPEVFLKKAQEVNADIIALSCLMTTTLYYQRETVEYIRAHDPEHRFRTMVGGGPVTQAWANEIKADGYGRDAIDAVKAAKKLLGIPI